MDTYPQPPPRDPLTPAAAPPPPAPPLSWDRPVEFEPAAAPSPVEPVLVERWAPPAPPVAEPAPAAARVEPLLSRPLTLVRLAIFFYGVVALFAFGYAIFSGHIGTLLGEGPPRLQHVLAAVGVGLIIVAGSRVGVRIWKPFARAAEVAGGMLGPLSLREALILALLSGTAEELLFRGALWPTLSLVGTTLLFAVVHIAPRRALWVYPLFAGVCGLLLGLLRDGTDSVIPPMVAHIVVNALNLAWLGRQARAAANPAPAVTSPA